MPHGVLLDTGNRLLGGATSDFSLYGAQPAVTIGPAAPPPADPTLLTVPSSAPASPAEAAVDPAAPAFTDDTPIAVQSVAAAPPGALLLAVQPSVIDPQTLAPQVASPTGSGSIAPIVADTALPVTARAADPDAAQVATQADPSPGLAQDLAVSLAATSLAVPILSGVDAIVVPATALAPTITALVPPALDTAAQTIGSVVSTIGAAATDTAALLDGVAVDTAVPSVGATVGAAAAIVPDPNPIADTVAAAAAATVDTLTAAAAPVVAAAAPAVESVTETAAAVAAPIVDTLAGTATTAADLTAAALPEEPLGGTDPAAGVTTLVSMVETDAVFEIGQSSEKPDDDSASESIIDTLASDEAPSALLGHAADTTGDGLLSKHDDDDGAQGLI